MLVLCSICQDPLDNVHTIVATKCGHVFHNICLTPWLQRSTSCPECRRNIFENSITELFLNSGFDNLANNSTSLIPALKDQLHAKNLEILEKDRTIKRWQTYLVLLQKELDKTQKKQMELEIELSAKKRDLQKLHNNEAKIYDLLLEKRILEHELELMNNIKTMVEGCCSDANTILAEAQAHVLSEDGRIATRKMAIYCSVIKQELAQAIEQKTNLQNEVTNVRYEMELLEEKYTNIMTLIEPQKRRSVDASPHQSFRKDHVKTNSTSQCVPKSDSKKKGSPIPFDFPDNKKKKICFDKDSVSRVGYNGLGGHGRIVTGSGLKRSFSTVKKK